MHSGILLYARVYFYFKKKQHSVILFFTYFKLESDSFNFSNFRLMQQLGGYLTLNINCGKFISQQ
jgi:hypothetical protein